MSLLDLASLVLAPTATKEGKVYSAIPDTGDGDMTCTRGSSATRVNSAGLIEKERGNLLLQSNSFDTTWSTSNASVTGGQSGYDGSSDAWLLEATATTNKARLQQGVSLTGVHTTSIYAKAGTTDWIAVQMFSNHFAYFDVANGIVGGSGSAIDTSIEAVGNGYYRCSITYNASSVSNIWVYVIDANGSTNVTSGKTAYIQSAQIEQGLIATDVITTTTTAVYEGITDDVPRVDYSGGGCPSLLLEGSRTNLIASSEYFDSSVGWESVGSFTANATISPEGLMNASSLNTDYLEVRPSVVSGTDYTYSIFVKANTDTTPQIIFTGTSFPNTQANYDLNTGSVTSYTTQMAGIDDYGNGWYRIYATETATATDSTSRLRFYCQTSYIYGAMFEAGSYVSSYINSYGTSTTRVADVCSKTGISELIGQTEGTLFFEGTIEGINPTTARRVVSLSDGTNSNLFQVINLDNSLDLRYELRSANSSVFTINDSNAFSLGQKFKFAFAYANNNFAFYVNGNQVGTSTSGSVIATSVLRFARGDGANPFEGANSQLLLFKTRLSNDELAELTKL